MIGPTPAEIAARDQLLATTRTMAEFAAAVHGEFIRAGFNREEAFDLLLFHLDHRHHAHHDEPD